MSPPAELPPSSGRRTMASLLADRLRQDVLTGSLKPGARLSVRELAERYDAGTIPLREALSRLSTSGFVTAEDQRGFRVAEVSAEEVLDIHKQRTELEGIALRESIRASSVQWEAELIAAHHRMASIQGHLLASDPEWEHEHIQFHLQLVSGCGSPWLLRFIQTLIEHSLRYRQLGSRALAQATRKRDVAGEHKAILDATLARDADLACALLKAHYRETSRIVVEAISAGAGEKASTPQ